MSPRAGSVKLYPLSTVENVYSCGTKVYTSKSPSFITGKPGGGGATLLNVRFSQFTAADHLTYWYEDCSSL
ncbi:MAG TPA: hypothetical protein VFZ67_13365 [Nitrososphaera sp.]